MSDKVPNVLYLALLLVLVGSALFSRRLPLGNALKMGIAWAAIFAIMFVLVTFRHDFAEIGQRLRAEITGEPLTSGATVRIPISEDGHFWVQGELNGHSVRFLVDSGASITTVGQETAVAAGLETGIRVNAVDTANGTILMKRGSADSLQIGTIERRDISVNVNQNDSINVLGMNFLSSLRSWRVEGRQLVLEP